jgi:hypothetical protein
MMPMSRVARTLPMASAGGEPELKFAGSDWQRVESAYGVRLAEDVRSEIVKATTSFAYF